MIPPMGWGLGGGVGVTGMLINYFADSITTE